MVGIGPELTHHVFVVLGDASEHHAPGLQSFQRFVDTEPEARKAVLAADFRGPGERRAGFGDHAGPQGAVEIHDHTLLPVMAGEGDQAIDMDARHDRLAPVRVPVQGGGERGEVGTHVEDGLPLALRALQQPARGAEMREAHQPVIDEVVQPLGSKGSRRVDEMYVVIAFDEFSEGEIGATEPVPVANGPAVSHAQRLDRGFGEPVQQDRLGRHRPQLFDDIARLHDIEPGRVAADLLRSSHHDRSPRPQRADDDGVVRPFRGQAHIVGEARGYAQVEAPPRAFAAQEVSFHLNVAFAEQQQVETPAVAPERGDPQGFAGGPAGVRAFLPSATELLEQGVGVASVSG